MPNTPPPEYHRGRWVALTIWIAAFTAAGSISLWQVNSLVQKNRQLAMQGEQAHVAICALRNDLQVRVVSSQRFLKDHPTGVLGIPAAVILNSIEGQKQTIATLDTSIDCPKGAP